jgi:hypothetical protein
MQPDTYYTSIKAGALYMAPRRDYQATSNGSVTYAPLYPTGRIMHAAGKPEVSKSVEAERTGVLEENCPCAAS